MSSGLCVLHHSKPAEATHGRACAHHHAMLREQLRDVLEMFALLPLYLLPGSAQPDDGSMRTKKSTIPAPIRLEVAALTDPRKLPDDVDMDYRRNFDVSKGILTSNGPDLPTIPQLLAGWAEYVRQERRLAAPEMPAGGLATVSASIRTLTDHLDWLTADDLLQTFTEELRAVHRALAIGIGQPVPKPLGSCYILTGTTECGGPIWVDGDGAKCSRCKHRWPVGELVRLRLILEGDKSA